MEINLLSVFYSLILIIICIIISLFYISKKKPSFQDRVGISISFAVFIFICVLSLFCWLSFEWIDKIRIHFQQLVDSADYARVVYESRSLLSTSATLVAVSLALFVPLLITIWNNFLDLLSKQAEKHRELEKKGVCEAYMTRLNDDLTEIKSAFNTIVGLNWLRIPFNISIIGATILLVLIASIYLSPEYNIRVYYKAVIINILSILLFIFYVLLLFIYLTSFQLERRKVSYLERLIYPQI